VHGAGLAALLAGCVTAARAPWTPNGLTLIGTAGDHKKAVKHFERTFEIVKKLNDRCAARRARALM
jgi:hypothetical protein